MAYKCISSPKILTIQRNMVEQLLETLVRYGPDGMGLGERGDVPSHMYLD